MERVVVERTVSSARNNLCRVALAISKCGARALEEECLAPNAKQWTMLRSQKRNWLCGSLAALTLRHTDEPMRAALRFVFESARSRLDSTKWNGAGSFLNGQPGCGRDGSMNLQPHYHDQGTVLRCVQRLFPAQEKTRQMAWRNPRHTRGHLATTKAR